MEVLGFKTEESDNFTETTTLRKDPFKRADTCKVCCLLFEKFELTTPAEKLESTICSKCKIQRFHRTSNSEEVKLPGLISIEKKISQSPQAQMLTVTEQLEKLKLTVTELRAKNEELSNEKVALKIRYKTVVNAQLFATNWETDIQNAMLLELESLAKENSHLLAENTILSEANKTISAKLNAETEKGRPPKKLQPERKTFLAPPPQKSTPQYPRRWFRSTSLIPGVMETPECESTNNKCSLAQYQISECQPENVNETKVQEGRFYGPHPFDLFW